MRVLSIQDGGMQIRRAAATAREALVDRAAGKLGVSKADLVVRGGVVGVRDGQQVGVVRRARGRSQTHDQGRPAAPLKDPKDYAIVGKPVPRLDLPAKIFGTFDFVQDVKVPGMLHARVVHPAGVRSTLQGFDDSACRKIKGYVRAVRKGDFLAVVATDEWAAISASTAIIAKWSAWTGLPEESRLFEYVRNSKVDRNEVFQSTGNTAEALKAGGRMLQATYELAMNTHGSIGPSCAVADFKKAD
jgi:CO/xanthine dehydrogenase Mo-binding subunit